MTAKEREELELKIRLSYKNYLNKERQLLNARQTPSEHYRTRMFERQEAYYQGVIETCVEVLGMPMTRIRKIEAECDKAFGW